jgi:asparagine synthase (glutamine-hydrolysing)
MPVKTFSVGFGKWINELPYASLVAKRYCTDHHEMDFGVPPVAELLERMVMVYDEPFADSSNIPTYLISEFARRHVKVVLSGDGGDELFGGYWWYLPLVLSEKLSASPFQWIILRLFSLVFMDRFRSIRLRSVAAGLASRSSDVWGRNVILQTQFKLRERRSLWGTRSFQIKSFVPGDYYRPPPGTKGLNQAFHFDLSWYLPGDILVKVDRAAMAHGLETRAPLLDRDVVEFALSLPATLKVRYDQEKVVFRQACHDYWPQELHSRGKQGFGAPYSAWLAMPDVQVLRDKVLADGAPLRSLLPGLSPHRYNRNPFREWMLLTLGLWLERNAMAMGKIGA